MCWTAAVPNWERHPEDMSGNSKDRPPPSRIPTSADCAPHRGNGTD
jgi:hypothetical protein